MDWERIKKELVFRTSRSGGPGGQLVNKVESRVELLFDIPGSESLTDRQKERLRAVRSRQISDLGVLRLTCGSRRSQSANKREVVARFVRWVEDHLHEDKKRIATKPSKASRQRRLDQKKGRSDRKATRQKINPNRDV